MMRRVDKGSLEDVAQAVADKPASRIINFDPAATWP